MAASRPLPTRREFLRAVAGAAGLSAMAARGDEPRPRKPNVVIVLTDDQGWGDLSLHGNENLATPNVDRLAQGGALLERFYVQPVCAPTRAELLTGRYYPRTGVHGVTRRAEWLNLDETTLGDLFRAAGYATGCFGKWHNGSAYPLVRQVCQSRTRPAPPRPGQRGIGTDPVRARHVREH